MKVPRKSGLITTTLMRCIAAMPGPGGSCASARITKAENAKKTPPMVAAPSTPTRIRIASTRAPQETSGQTLRLRSSE